jgi:TctA family transporter
MDLQMLKDGLAYANSAAGILLIAYILRTRLFASYPFLLAFLVTDEVQAVLRTLYSHVHGRDQILYMAGNALKLIFLVLMMWDVFRATFEEHPSVAA